jgi:hypothetical protein
MSYKIYKLSYKSKEEFDSFKKANLTEKDSEGNEVIKTGYTILSEGRLPKAPPADFVPDPDCNPEKENCNGWSEYPDWAVDIMTKEKTDSFNDYLIPKPKKVLVELQGAVNTEIVYKT